MEEGKQVNDNEGRKNFMKRKYIIKWPEVDKW